MNASKKEEKIEKKLERREAPELIREIKRRFNVRQPQLAPALGISQQAVSDYEAGNVKRERYDVIKKLQAILRGEIVLPESARKLLSPGPEEVINYVRSDGENVSGDEPRRKRKPKKKNTSAVSSRRNKNS
jgi:transcriptional regulator with XRE-family HTH domain